MKRKKDKHAGVQKMSHSRNLVLFYMLLKKFMKVLLWSFAWFTRRLFICRLKTPFSFWCIAIRENAHRRTHVHTDILNIRFCVYLMIPDVLTHPWSFWK